MDVDTLLLLDLSAADATIDNATLIDRLSVSFRIHGLALNWFCSYFSGKKNSVWRSSVIGRLT